MAVTGPKLLILGLGLLLGMQVGLGDLFSVFDFRWGFLAVGTAFRVTASEPGSTGRYRSGLTDAQPSSEDCNSCSELRERSRWQAFSPDWAL